MYILSHYSGILAVVQFTIQTWENQNRFESGFWGYDVINFAVKIVLYKIGQNFFSDGSNHGDFFLVNLYILQTTQNQKYFGNEFFPGPFGILPYYIVSCRNTRICARPQEAPHAPRSVYTTCICMHVDTVTVSSAIIAKVALINANSKGFLHCSVHIDGICFLYVLSFRLTSVLISPLRQF